MIVGILQVELTIDGSTSLKDKRRVISSLKDQLHRHHQVSVAEVGQQDNHRSAMLGIAMVSSDRKYCQGSMDRILNRLRAARGCYLADHRLELLAGN